MGFWGTFWVNCSLVQCLGASLCLQFIPVSIYTRELVKHYIYNYVWNRIWIESKAYTKKIQSENIESVFKCTADTLHFIPVLGPVVDRISSLMANTLETAYIVPNVKSMSQEVLFAGINWMMFQEVYVNTSFWYAICQVI